MEYGAEFPVLYGRPCWLSILFIFLVMLCGMWDLSSPTRDQTCALQWKHKVLTTGPPGSPITKFFKGRKQI